MVRRPVLSIGPAADRAAALMRLRAVEPYADGTAEEIAEGAALLDLRADGDLVGAAVLDADGGPVATLKAAAATAHAWEFLAGLECVARQLGAVEIVSYTRRPGMVRQQTRRGWRAVPANDGFTEMRKGLA